ncbi:hypothetical protein ACT80S_00865 [Ramlibacter sp. MAHUQ-53]|uniref:hypothetical protein n=1 Tax=unclassified Ramlibacter TaxID=2617605 RepID=UPI00363A4499
MRACIPWRGAAGVAWVAAVTAAADGFHIVTRFLWIGGHGLADHARRAVFLGEHLAAALAVYACSRLERRLAWPLLALFGLGLAADLAAHAALGRPASLSNIAVFQAAAGHVVQAWHEFPGPARRAAGWTLLLLAPLVLLAGPAPGRRARRLALASVAGLLALYAATLAVRGEQALIGFPKGFAYGFGAAAVAVDARLQAGGAGAVRVPREDRTHAASRVVLLVDESIRHDVFARVFDAGAAGAIDYGLARSAANCSASANLLLRKAGWVRTGEASAPVRAYESLFSLARRAGYATAYVDTQNVLAEPGARNYFDPAELAAVDRVVAVRGPAHGRDPASLRALGELLRPARVFVIVNKVGAHFPYAEMIPPGLRRGARLADYEVAVRVNAAQYLAQVARLVGEGTVVFYTSDHGQDFDAPVPHCNVGAQVRDAEYAVPFVVLAGDAATRAALRQRQPRLHGRLGHLEVAESVRNALGYAFDDVDSVYKPPRRLHHGLCAIHGPPRPFFGMGPRCRPQPAAGQAQSDSRSSSSTARLRRIAARLDEG